MTFDRGAAGKIVEDMSRDGTVFGYYYKTTVGGKGAYQVVTPSGTSSLVEFKARPPRPKDGTPTARVVLFGEPDTILENRTVATEPLWRSVRGSFPELLPSPAAAAAATVGSARTEPLP